MDFILYRCLAQLRIGTSSGIEFFHKISENACLPVQLTVDNAEGTHLLGSVIGGTH